jgi:hypothetical protein
MMLSKRTEVIRHLLAEFYPDVQDAVRDIERDLSNTMRSSRDIEIPADQEDLYMDEVMIQFFLNLLCRRAAKYSVEAFENIVTSMVEIYSVMIER